MKFIIHIASRIRPGQFPKLPDFQFSQERQMYLYAGRELDVAEFNAAAERVFDPKYNSKGYVFRPVAIEVLEPIQEPEPIEEQPPQAVEHSAVEALPKPRKKAQP